MTYVLTVNVLCVCNRTCPLSNDQSIVSAEGDNIVVEIRIRNQSTQFNHGLALTIIKCE